VSAQRFVLSLALAAAAPGFESSQPDPWTAADLVKPAQLASHLPQSVKDDPLLLQVGFPVLFKGAHIPNSAYAGPGSKPAGIDELKKAVAGVPKTRQIVLYCGCCPWNQCPNMRPAFRVLREMGFTDVKALEIPTNMRTDWIEKGYPVERASQ